MAQYMIRVELYGVDDPEVYKALHEEMEHSGFFSTVSVEGKEYHLPQGEYRVTSPLSPEEMREVIKEVFEAIGQEGGMVVTETALILTDNLKPVTDEDAPKGFDVDQ